MILLALGLARAEPPDPGESLALVDALAWGWTDKELSRWLDRAAAPEGPFAEALRPPDRERLGREAQAPVYAVEARLDEQGGLTVGGRLAVVWTNRAEDPVQALVLRFFPMAEGVRDLAHGASAGVLQVWIDGQPARYGTDGSLVFVELPERVAPGGRARVLLHFWADVPRFDPRDEAEIDVLPVGGIGAFGAADEVVNLGHWLPVVVPHGPDGKFDAAPLRDNTEHATYEPANFHVLLETDPRYTVASTGVQVRRDEGGGRATWVGVAALAREFAVELVPDATISETEVGGTRIRVLHRGRDGAMGHHLLDYAEQSFRVFAERFGPVGSREIDIVEAPLAHVLGVEHPELAVVDATHKGVPYHRSQEHEWTVAHEVAHQWWAMAVGNDAGREPWLDEALASWSADLYLEDRYGPEAVAMRRELEIVAPTRSLRDGGVLDVPADLEAWRYDLRQYGAVVYGRASLFFDRVRDEIGEPALVAALRAYHLAHRDRFASARDLLEALRDHAPDPAAIDLLHRRWVAEGHGYEDLLDPQTED